MLKKWFKSALWCKSYFISSVSENFWRTLYIFSFLWLYCRRTVLSPNSPVDELSCRQTVPSANCPIGEMSGRWTVLSANCLVDELSGRRIVCRRTVLWRTVRRRSVRVPTLPVMVRLYQDRYSLCTICVYFAYSTCYGPKQNFPRFCSARKDVWCYVTTKLTCKSIIRF